ncbi:DUF551 domain-containing protein [Salmonella enterica subsp. enterica serovar Saintpaul]|nr:DUF551 domain-containing protein [Salmonella enterica subsp. enterica serovar Saintpaul]EBX0750015.1 DUF551 domain-containing protein [Salmonella enterica subsp. enterica serovar Saintpaul]ECB0581690.1 DUF551 domain-containing protein [Salmonella enterica subsp. enterica serovar Saintpaul]ECI6579363.1 DUF551 domain-containing protein [Salmonella enterica subsp. enterica serovar Saintpaul]
MTPEQRSEHDAEIAEFKSMLGMPATVVPDEMPVHIGPREFGRSQAYVDGWNACRAAMLQAGKYPATQDGWIPVSERMPADGDIVLVVDDGYFVCEAQHRSGNFYSTARGRDDFFEAECRDVAHWMPLPAAPQQEVIGIDLANGKDASVEVVIENGKVISHG